MLLLVKLQALKVTLPMGVFHVLNRMKLAKQDVVNCFFSIITTIAHEIYDVI